MSADPYASLKSFRLSRRSPLRMPLMALNDGLWEPSQHLPPVLAALEQTSASKWRERRAAACLLALAPLDKKKRAQAAAALCNALHRPASYGCWASYIRALGRTAAFFMLVAVVGSLIPGDVPLGSRILGFLSWTVISLLLSVFLSPFALPFSALFDTSRNNRARAAAAQALGSLPFPGVATDLARACTDWSAEVRFEAQRSLPASLALLGPEHFGAMPSDLLAAPSDLLRQMAHDRYFDWLTVPVLQALRHVGDGTLLSAVNLAARTASTPAVRDEAAGLIPLLQERARKSREASVLLRPAAHAPEDNLLRPAGAAASDPDQLLRSVAQTDDE